MSETSDSPRFIMAQRRGGFSVSQPADAMEAARPYGAGALIFVGIILLIFFGIGISLASVQSYRLMTYVPVKATIASASVDVHYTHSRHGNSANYSPAISYWFIVNGKAYSSSRVLAAGSVSGSLHWAEQVIARYPVDSTATAWISPTDPSSAFLDREVQFFPYIFALFPGVLYAFLIASVASGQSRSNRAVLPSGQWQTLHASQPPSLLFRRAVITALLWMGYALILLGDYLYLRSGNVDLFFTIAIVCAIGLAWLILHMPWKRYRAMQNYGPVELSAAPGDWIQGGSIAVRLNYDARNSAPLKDVAIGLICLKSQVIRHGKNSQFQSIPMFHLEQPIALPYASGVCTAEAHLPIPPGIHATGREGRANYPRYDWFVGVRLHATDQPELVLRYPINIAAGAQAT